MDGWIVGRWTVWMDGQIDRQMEKQMITQFDRQIIWK